MHAKVMVGNYPWNIVHCAFAAVAARGNNSREMSRELSMLMSLLRTITATAGLDCYTEKNRDTRAASYAACRRT